MNKTQIVIIGGGYAGVITALRLAGKDRGKRADVTLINAVDTFTQRIRLHQLATDQPLRQYPIPRLLGKRNVNFVQGWVTDINLDQHTVQVNLPDGAARTVLYDKLVYALGSIPATVNIPGVAEHTYSVGSREEAAALRQRLQQVEPGSRVVVVGGGLTGIETVTEIAEAYPQLQVHLVTAGAVGEKLSGHGRDYLMKVFETLHIGVYEQTRVQAVEDGALFTADGQRIAFDVAVWGGSFVAAPLARAVGLPVNARGQILVDPYLRAISHPDVYVAGDAAAFVTQPGAPIRMACATAMPMGTQVGDNLLAVLNDQPQQRFHFNYFLQCISLGRDRGLVQFVRPDDTALERTLTGSAGALVKELICQFTVRSMQLERMLPGTYTWPGKGKIPVDAPHNQPVSEPVQHL